MFGFKVITQYEQGIVFRLGRALPGIRQPGLTWVNPLTDRLRKVNMQIVAAVVPAQEAITRDNVTLGLSSPAFAGMILSSPVLLSRAREILDQRERALGDAIAAETGTDIPQQRLVAALLASVHRVLAAEATQRSLAGQPREQICAVLADAATRAFDLLEPSLGSYGIRAQPG